MEFRRCAALIALIVLTACSSPDATDTMAAADPATTGSGAASPTSSAPPDRSAMSKDDAETLVRRLRDFARQPTRAKAEELPFAPTVQLGLGETLVKEVNSADLADRSAWAVPTTTSYRWIGQPSLNVLERLADDEPYVTSIGPHAHCAAPARSAPPEVAGHDHVSTQPAQPESCLSWYSVDLFIEGGEIQAVTLALWEP